MKKIICLIALLFITGACSKNEEKLKFDHPIIGEWDAEECYYPSEDRTYTDFGINGRSFTFTNHWTVSYWGGWRNALRIRIRF
ncbi:hypothetical protein LJC43_00110 [Parabacteroides sp. OttesenSCG-928-G21]|nr:hypothetical protein [Parabacteroides sp. OttesenSCG-928-G21]